MSRLMLVYTITKDGLMQVFSCVFSAEHEKIKKTVDYLSRVCYHSMEKSLSDTIYDHSFCL